MAATLPDRVAIVGAGRMGRGLALALDGEPSRIPLLVREARAGSNAYVWPAERWRETLRTHQLILIATPDAAIDAVAATLASTGSIGTQHVVLHLSGLLDRGALEPLVESGAALGSLHPLQTVSDPATAPERLRGSYAGVEGDARAVAAGTALAERLGMRPVPIPPDGKVAYHLGATFVANYTAALLALGQGFAERAGIPTALAGEIYRPLLAGAAANLVADGAVRALTGAVRRGDVATITAHLGRVSGRERRLYCDLGIVALGLAREAGLDPAAAARVEALLTAG